jgi:hypothetical protein
MKGLYILLQSFLGLLGHRTRCGAEHDHHKTNGKKLDGSHSALQENPSDLCVVGSHEFLSFSW